MVISNFSNVHPLKELYLSFTMGSVSIRMIYIVLLIT